jgi:hypothetical protein
MLGMGGVLFHCLLKMKRLKEEAISANVKFNWYDTYVKKSYIAIILSFLSVFLWFMLFGEWEKKYPSISGIRRTLFVVSGFSGSYIIQFVLDGLTNSAKKYIQKFVDVKSNVSDITTGPVATLNDLINKGSAATGEDVTKAPPAPKNVDVPDKPLTQP